MTRRDWSCVNHVRLTRRGLLKTLAMTGGGGSLLAACGPTSGAVVEMTDTMTFVPAKLTIKVGEVVTWRNTSAFVHTATGDPAKVMDPMNVQLPEGTPAWDSGPLKSGQSWSHRFDIPGEYRYCCLPHELGGMVATIAVET